MEGHQPFAATGRTRPAAQLAVLRPLLGQINDLKRIRAAGSPGSLADQGFVRSWADLIRGQPPDVVARREVAFAVASARLGGINAAILDDAGLDQSEIMAILRGTISEVIDPLVSGGVGLMESSLESLADPATFREGVWELPEFVGRLQAQPRAGATRPGHARLMLEPPENHAEHSYVTAAYAGLVSPIFGADPAVAFLAGLAHHFHNAYLPDSGFAGEELLGAHLAPIMERFTERALAQLPGVLIDHVRSAREVLIDATTPAGKAFHAGDVVDRVLQMEQYSRVAAFETRHALVDLDLVHPGPVQAFHLEVLTAVGLWS